MKALYFCWIFFLLAKADETTAAFFSSLRVEPPETVPQVKYGTTWKVTCFGNASVKWFKDGIEVKNNATTTVTTDEIKHSATLQITKITRTVKHFECKYVKPGNESLVVYPRVYDLFLNATGQVIIVTAKKNESATLPCIPYSKNVTVKLYLHGGNEEWDLNDTRITFDMTEGFTIHSVKLDMEGQHYCLATEGTQQESMFVLLLLKEELKETPRINATFAESVKVGDDFNISCSVVHPSPQVHYFSIEWMYPNGSSGNGVLTRQLKKDNRFALATSTLTVNDTTKDDEGDYTCILKSFTYTKNSTYFVNVYDDSQEFLNVSAVSSNINVLINETAKWVIDLHGVPAIQKKIWFDKFDNPATTKRKFTINETTPKKVVLTINKVSRDDDGQYKFFVSNGKENRTLTLNLTVTGDPDVKIEYLKGSNVYEDFVRVNTAVTFICTAKGFPEPEIQWELEECEVPEKCRTIPLGSGTKKPLENDQKGIKSFITTNITKNGHIHCIANNTISTQQEDKEISVLDFESKGTGFDLLGIKNPIEKESLELTCAARRAATKDVGFSGDFKWLFQRNDGFVLPILSLNTNVTNEMTPWSYKSILKIKNINQTQSGNYSCSISNLSGEEVRLLEVVVRKMTPPVFSQSTTGSLDGSTKSYTVGDTIPDLVCQATGTPQPKIVWFKDDKPETEWQIELNPIRFNDSNKSILKIPSKSNYAGEYKCVGENGFTNEQSVHIQIDGNHWWWIIIIVFLSSVVVILVVCLVLKIYKDKKAKSKLMRIIQEGLEKGQPENINPELPVNEQVTLLPYYDTYEIPTNKVTLGMILGSGAFGIVKKAEVMVPGQTIIAAVKMVKPNSNDLESHLEALVRELKILVHLGQHVNVVNLIGACTKNFAKKKELLVIVEYCKYGNLMKYLQKHRLQFKNELNSSTGKIDANYYANRFSQRASAQRLNYAALTFAHSQSTQGSQGGRYLQLEQIQNCPENRTGCSSPGHDTSYITGSNVRTVNTEMSFVSDGTEGGHTMDTNYAGDYYHDVDDITTTVLVCWAFQIASGMDFLASRNVVHGDLAARNVLLAEGNVVKICDFGLARNMYQALYLKPDKNEVMPIKWMSIESIRDWRFSTKSDVWSYGVLLWELFTLGNSPYPGMPPDAQFVTCLEDGYRMDKPAYAPSDLYDLMNECWRAEPENRPTFQSIADTLGDMLHESLREHYVDLYESCIRENRKMMEGREDYLKQMPVSEIQVKSSYVNIEPENPSDDYLQPLPPKENADYAVMQSECVPPKQNIVNNLGYHTINASESEQNQSSSVNIFSPRPRPTESRDRVDFGGFELTTLSPSNDSNVISNKLSPDSNMDQELNTSKVNGFSNVGYLPCHLFDAKAIPKSNDSKPEVETVPLQNGDDKKELQKRKKNDSGVSSSSSGQVSDNESPRSLHKEFNKVPNNLTKSNNSHNVVENQNYFNCQSILPES